MAKTKTKESKGTEVVKKENKNNQKDTTLAKKKELDYEPGVTLAELGIGWNWPTIKTVLSNLFFGLLLSLIPIGLINYKVTSTPYYRDAYLVRIQQAVPKFNASLLIEHAEAKNDWTNKFSNDSQIIAVNSLPKESSDLGLNLIREKFAPTMNFANNLDKGQLFMYMHDMFIVKSSGEHSHELEAKAFEGYAADIMYTVNLNDDYEGGEHQFELGNHTVTLAAGEAMAWPNKIHHHRTNVTKGTQYRIVGFGGIHTGFFSTNFGQFMTCLHEMKDNRFIKKQTSEACVESDKDTCEDSLDTVEKHQIGCNSFRSVVLNRFQRKFIDFVNAKNGYLYLFNYVLIVSFNIAILYVGFRMAALQ